MSIISSLQSSFNSTVANAQSAPGALPLRPTDNVPLGYLVTISGTDETGKKIGYNNSGSITAFLPEQFEMRTTSSWDTLLPSDLGALLGGYLSSATKDLTTVGRLTTGFTGQVPALSQLFWVSTTPIQFTLNLQFNAVSSAAAEVTGNITSLLSLTLPSLVSVGKLNFLQAPGPSLIANQSYSSKYNINMSIGSQWLFSNVIIQDVAATIDTLPTAQGDYISAGVHLFISTDRIYTKTDLSQAFSDSAQTSSNIPPGIITAITNSPIGSAISSVAGAVKSGIVAVGNAI